MPILSKSFIFSDSCEDEVSALVIVARDLSRVRSLHTLSIRRKQWFQCCGRLMATAMYTSQHCVLMAALCAVQCLLIYAATGDVNPEKFVGECVVIECKVAHNCTSFGTA